jgi:pyruvate dehydrogenase E1 component alpha subunit
MRDRWRPLDPLIRVKRYLERRGAWDQSADARMEREVGAALDEAWQQAQAERPSTLEESLRHVFAEMPSRLREQHDAVKESRRDG